MNQAACPLLDVTLDQAREGWAGRLEVDLASFENSGLTLISREGSYGITTLKFFDSIVAICQPALLPILSPLSPGDLLNMSLLLKSLNGHVANPIGIASISYTDSATLKEPPHFGVAHEGNSQEVELILSGCTKDEQEESGVATMPFIFIADSVVEKPGAVASYEIWNGKIAQLGVLTKPEHRGQGLASSAAHAAAKAALATGLIPQWRCQIGNVSSYRLSQKLGFHQVGLQLAIGVVPSSS